MIVELTFLLAHRCAAERRAVAAERTDVAVTRDILAALEGEADGHAFASFNLASTAERLRAARRLIQLVRGDDRERLFEISEQAHLFDDALTQLDHRLEVRRIEGVRELELFGSPVCIEGLQRCLAYDISLDVRLQAAVALSNLGHLPECRELLAMLDLSERPLTRMHMGLFRSIAARDCAALVELGRDEAFRRQRPMLVDALGWTADFGVLATLARHSEDPDPEVRCAALRAARRIGHPAASSWIGALLLDPAEPVRIQAIQACGDLGLRDTVPILLSLAQSPSWWVRTRTAEAMAKLRTDGRAPAEDPSAGDLEPPLPQRAHSA